jgi:hypothetical protein
VQVCAMLGSDRDAAALRVAHFEQLFVDALQPKR